MLNCGLGVLFLPVLGAVFLIKGGSFISILGEMFGPELSADCIPVIVCTAICAAASMNDMAAPSVSLEGRSLWLAQSLPVVPWQILRAKLSVQLILTVFPAIFCFACAVIVYPFAPAADFGYASRLDFVYSAFSAVRPFHRAQNAESHMD